MISSEIIQQVWDRTPPVVGYNPVIWKKDMAGAWIRRDLYGSHSTYGWEIDHIRPRSRGGTDLLVNLQALHWRNNESKKDSYPEFETCETSDGNSNKQQRIRWRITNG